MSTLIEQDVRTDVDAGCAHCTLPVPRGLNRAGDAQQFCCAGCRAVYEQIHACGLEDYYRLRDAGELSPEAAQANATDAAAFDAPAYAELYVRRDGDRCATEFVLGGVTCAACVWLVEQLPHRLPGLIEARLSLTDSTLRIAWDATRLKLSQVAAELMRFGYRPHPARGVKQSDLFRRELRARIVDLGVAGAIAGNLMLFGAALYAGWISGIDRQYEQLMRWFSLGLGVTALAWPGREFFRGAIAAVRLRRLNFDFPIAMALLAGGLASTVNVVRGRGEIYFDSLSTLVFLVLVGRLIQFTQQRRARGAVELLFALTPSSCRVVDAGGVARTVPIQSLAVGDVIEVRPEELFPADGFVVDGASSVDASLLTGEPVPVAVAAGDAVYGGARNVEATLRVRVAAAGEETRVGRLMRLLERGLADKPPIVRLTDRVAARFTYVVLAASVVTLAAWWHLGAERAIETTIALLVVTCPCVLGLTVPMTFAVTIGRLARRGILVKSAAALERVARGGRLVLDKTGTLTLGQMRVVDWAGDPQWQAVVGAVERESTHPIGRALREAYESREPSVAMRPARGTLKTWTGGGVGATLADGREVFVGSRRMAGEMHARFASDELLAAAEAHDAAGRTTVCVVVDSTIEAVAALADTLRSETPAALARLRVRGFVPEICSGDTQGAVDRVAGELDIRVARGGMSPEAKLAAVRAGGAVMIGDGVNDAAALAAADVGIAVAGGAEAALAAADVYIARGGPEGVVELVESARHALGLVRRHVLIATTYNVIAGTAAALGYMHPLAAALVMPVSSATVLAATIASARCGPRAARLRTEGRRWA